MGNTAKPMTEKQIDSYIAKKEGKKHQASIGDVREVRKELCILMAQNPFVIETMLVRGRKILQERAKASATA